MIGIVIVLIVLIVIIAVVIILGALELTEMGGYPKWGAKLILKWGGLNPSVNYAIIMW